jgi:hypothetical protein
MEDNFFDSNESRKAEVVMMKSPRSSGMNISQLKMTPEDQSDDESDMLSEQFSESQSESEAESVKEYVTDPLGIMVPEEKTRISHEAEKQHKKKELKNILVNKWKSGLSRYKPQSDIQKFIEKHNCQLLSQYTMEQNGKKCMCMFKIITSLGDPMFLYISNQEGAKYLKSDVELKEIKGKSNLSYSLKNGLIKNLPPKSLGLVFTGDNNYNVCLNTGTEKILSVDEKNSEDEYMYPLPILDISEFKKDPDLVSVNISNFVSKTSDSLRNFNIEKLYEIKQTLELLTDNIDKFIENQENIFRELDESKEFLKQQAHRALDKNRTSGINLDEMKFGPIIYNIYQRNEMAIRLSRFAEGFVDSGKTFTQLNTKFEKINKYLEEEYVDLDSIFDVEEN